MTTIDHELSSMLVASDKKSKKPDWLESEDKVAAQTDKISVSVDDKKTEKEEELPRDLVKHI